ncbi:ATP-binding protein [Parabacteroides sp. AM08-6]|uniref:sensor histidine kinase n=1 Tax=Parabacteroides sp. AM08-6 TaxID=2292053 RepID=UPI000EFEC765|nr:ATP-binding protein [Parabacteroides sp. AM08-6]RHJ83898.1 PAS domain S-box protein [Parabacteroides sp. AM08-6]
MYENYSKEELLNEIKQLKEKKTSEYQDNIYKNRMLANMMALRETLSNVLSLLLNKGENIDQALLLILKFFDVNRAYIGIFDKDFKYVDFTHEVTSEGIISMREDLLRQLPEKDVPWWFKKIKACEDICIYDVSQMPEEASNEQHLLQLQEVASLLVLPVLREGEVCGFLGLDSVHQKRQWNALDVENLRMLADVVSIAIERERAQTLMEHSAKLRLKSEAKFRIIFEKLPWGVELYDADGNMLDLNDADLEIFGTTREQIIGINAFKSPNIPKWALQKLKKGEDVTFRINYDFQTIRNAEYYKTHIQNEVKHLQVTAVTLKDNKNEIFGYLYIIFDDTENYRKNEQTQYNLAKLKAAVNTGNSFIWEYDANTKNLTVDFSLNDNVENNEDLAFIQQHPVINLQEFFQTLDPEDADKVFSRQFKRLLNGEIDNFEATYRRMVDGKLFWFSSNIRTYKFNEDGTPSKIISYTSNITHQREKENELIRIKEADKLKSAFLANMSHEIRTPLNAIVGFSDIIAESESMEERQEFLDIIHKNNDLLLHLIDDILDFSKIEADTLEYHFDIANIKDICGEVFLASSLKMKPEVKLIFNKELPSIWLKTDAQRVMQVISNFINNAIKFTNEGSITLRYQQEGDYLRVSVQDTGIGIKEEDCARIFDRFIKINEFKQGTGLGLSISKTIIENLGGTIGVDSVKGSGSTFWFTLPLLPGNE